MQRGGDGTETYTPTFTYHGFQYVLVTGITEEQATPELLTYVVMHSDIKERGGFSCSDETVNILQTLTRRSDLSNFYYYPTDCPHREKNGWTADASLSCEHMLLNLEPEHSYREWMRNIYKTLNEQGALPGIIPTSGWFIQALAGIVLNPHRNNVDEVEIHPAFVPQLSHADGFHVAPAGRIAVSWKREGEDICLTVKLPSRMSGHIVLDAGYIFEDGTNSKPVAAGRYRIQIKTA